MARVNFIVTEVNDLSKDGAGNKRVQLEAKLSPHDGTGLVKNDPAPWAREARVEYGCLELLVDDATAAAVFKMGSTHGVEVTSIPVPDAKAVPEKKATKDPDPNANVVHNPNLGDRVYPDGYPASDAKADKRR